MQHEDLYRRKILRDATKDLDDAISDLSKTCCKTDMRDNLTFIRQVERIQHKRQDYLGLMTERCLHQKQSREHGDVSNVPDCWKFHKPKRLQLNRIIVDDVHKVKWETLTLKTFCEIPVRPHVGPLSPLSTGTIFFCLVVSH